MVKTLDLLKQADVEPEQIEQILQRDPILVGKLLATVNSPFYGRNRDVTSVKDAVMVVGFRSHRIKRLTTACRISPMPTMKWESSSS